jgi:GNAT superfamily N-acetyltransferase
VPSVSPPGPVNAKGLSVAVDDVRAVEQRAANAWPETHHQMLDGWRLRYSPGVPNRRANSVLPLYRLMTQDTPGAITKVEAFYHTHGLPSRFMVSPACEPDNLDQKLAERGYHIDAPTDVQWADSTTVELSLQNIHKAELLAEPDMDWMGVYMEGVADRHEMSVKRDLIRRIGADYVVARVDLDGGPVSVGLGVFDQGWTGIFCMHTLNKHRRLGFAGAVLGALTRWGREQGGDRMYLQVERDNPVARAFYERSGFETRYGYHYRTKES